MTLRAIVQQAHNDIAPRFAYALRRPQGPAMESVSNSSRGYSTCKKFQKYVENSCNAGCYRKCAL